MDILLTPEDIEREGWAAFDAWERESQCREMTPDSEAGHSAYRSWCDAWLCRAQVRKVYGYIRTHWVHARQLDYRAAQDNTVLLTIRSEDWQALREAAGGE